LSEDKCESVEEALERYAQQIHNLMKHRFLEDYETARFYDEIEVEGLHVDYLGIPFTTTAILYGLDPENHKLFVKVVDDKQIVSFIFQLKGRNKHR